MDRVAVNRLKMKKEVIVRGLGGTVSGQKSPEDHTPVVMGLTANKVLPISESTSTSSSSADENDECSNYNKVSIPEEEEKKTKTIKRMKDLLRRAAAAKAEIGGKYIRRKVMQLKKKANTMRAVTGSNKDEESNYEESPKISFRWDVESCSTTASSSSAFFSRISKSLDNNSIMTTTIDHAMSLPAAASHEDEEDDDLDFSSARSGSWITTDSDFVVLEL